MPSINPAIMLEIDMAAAGHLDTFSQQRLALALQIRACKGNVAVAVDHPVPGKRGAFRQALEDPANLARRTG